MQSAGRINQDHVHHSGFSGNDAIKGYSSWISTVALTNHIHANPIPPNLKLINGGCTKGVACDQERLTPGLLHPLCNFGDGGCFSYPIDSNDKGDKRFRAFDNQLINRTT